MMQVETPAEHVLTVHVQVADARELRRIQNRLWKMGRVRAQCQIIFLIRMKLFENYVGL